ncbi:MAG TPA: DUF2244 domain-containing protein [Caulobacteraceae bacterium]|jgi:uncharacterized membrane protein|nr:DUF2244 domain-containing protein [Caulobacteraceae bacterium]
MSQSGQLYMDAVITPNRSLSKRGFAILMGAMVGYNLVIALFMLVIGAFPVPIFLGLDVLGVGLAFHVSNRRARRAERVRVSAERIEVERQSRTVWRSPTAFTSVALEDAGDPHARVELRLSGRSITVGDRLSPAERAGFADALNRAIAAARAERHGP